MTQLKMEFFQPVVGNEKIATGEPVAIIKNNLEQYIKVCGLVDYKDFYMKIKSGLTAIPAQLTKEQYLTLAREVYESRAAKVERQTNRSKFFAVRNRIKKQGGR